MNLQFIFTENKLHIMKKKLLSILSLALSYSIYAQQPTPSCFNHGVDFNSGYPYEINRGDYNGDGHDDFAVVRMFADTISIYINAAVPNGFNINAPISYTTQQYPRAIATADFNKDGKSDIACVNGNPTGSIQELRLLFGGMSSMSSSTLAIPTHTNQMLQKIIAKDINGDTYDDIIVVVTQTAESQVYTYLNSNGTFSSATTTSILTTPGSNMGAADIGDFNNDGFGDYIGYAFPQFSSQGMLAVKLGTNTGAFATTTTTLTPPFANIQSIYCNDLNNDGFSDVIIGGLSGMLAIITGTTGGNFSAPTTYTNLTGSAYDLEVYDINNDGYKDIIASGVNSTRFNIMYGTSTALVFSNPNTYNAGDIFATNLAIGDYNMDGFKDVVTNNTATNLIGFNFNLNPALNAISTNTYCIGQVANLSAKYPYGNEFTWLPSGGTSSLANIYSSGTYSLVMSDAASNCSVTSIPVTLTFNTCTNINELNKTALSIYPNPTNSYITINSENDLGMIKITNLLGAEVLTLETKETTSKIDVSNLTSGVYFIKVKNSITKFIKE